MAREPIGVEGFIDVKTQSGQYGKEQRGNRGHLAGRNFAGPGKKQRERRMSLKGKYPPLKPGDSAGTFRWDVQEIPIVREDRPGWTWIALPTRERGFRDEVDCMPH